MFEEVAPNLKKTHNIKSDEDISYLQKSKPCSYKNLTAWQQQRFIRTYNLYIVYTYAAKSHLLIVRYTSTRHKTVSKWKDKYQLGFN